MSDWTCPECERTFARANAGHTCSPALGLNEWLAHAPAYERPVAQALIELAESMPDARVEPVQVGLFLKRRSAFAQLRTKTNWTALTVKLTRASDGPAPSLRVQRQGSRYFHTFNLMGPGALTDDLVALIGEAYEADALARRTLLGAHN